MSSNNVGNKIIDVKFGEKAVYLIFLDKRIKLTKSTYLKYGFYKNKELSDEEVEQIIHYDNLSKEIEKLKNSLISHPKTKSQLTLFLKKKEFSNDDIDVIIDELEKSSLLNDKNYLLSIVDYLNGKNYGEKKIKDYLYKKGFENTLINELDFRYDDEFNKAKNLLPYVNKKYSKCSYSEKKRKVYQFYLIHGFNESIASKMLSFVSKNSQKDDLEIMKKEYDKIKNRFSNDDLKVKEVKVELYFLKKGYTKQQINKLKEIINNEN